MGRAWETPRSKPGELRRGLMLYGSAAATAAALMLSEGGLGPAFAQSIGPRMDANTSAQGDFTVPGPTPTPAFESRSGTLDIVYMNRDAVLNWTTYDTAPLGGANGGSYVNFLPAGTELRFVGNGASFTAVNRIFTNPDNAGAYRGIAFQGQVTSYLSGDGANSVGPVGGNIWFFSPGGILATGGASFNVGSLLLTTSDLANFFEGGNFRSVDFTGVADPFSAVVLQTGARVTLTQPGSHFAIVAPTIEQGGDVSVNGSALYLSAEQGSLTFDGAGTMGAFVQTEAQAGNRIRHFGTTGGPASMGTDNFLIYDPQTIEFRTGRDVAVLLSGSIGYAPASSAALAANGSIVLSTGSVETDGSLALTSETSIDAPRVRLHAATGQAIRSGGDANGSYDIDIESIDGALAADAGALIDIAGSVRFSATSDRAALSATASAGAGNLAGGEIIVGGDLTLDASVRRFGGSAERGGSATAAIGDGGRIAVGRVFALRADSYAAADANGVVSARGGEAILSMTGAGAGLNVGDSLVVSAQGLPFSGNCECVGPGSGLAVGGTARFTATGGTIEVGSLIVSADAQAYGGSFTATGADTDATGGAALVDLGDSEASFSRIEVSARAFGARGSVGTPGGAGFGGTASFGKGAGGSLATQGIVVEARANGGAGGDPDGDGRLAARGGDAVGGTASIVLARNAQGLGYLELNAGAQGGRGGSGTQYNAESGAAGGDASGGTASLLLAGAGNSLSGVLEGGLDVAGSGGAGGNGGAAFLATQSGSGGAGGAGTGGSLTVISSAGAEFAWTLPFGVSGRGGTGGRGGDAFAGQFGSSLPGAGGAGGDARGGSLAIIADGGRIAGDLELEARGYGGDGGANGFDLDGNFTGNGTFGVGNGGAIALTARDNGASIFDVGVAALDASGDTAGRVAIEDRTSEPGAGMRFESLYVQASGDLPTSAPAVRVFAGNEAIVVDGATELTGDSIALDFAGRGRLSVGGFTRLSSGQGDIAITHPDNPGVLSIASGGRVEAYAARNYSAGAGSAVGSDDEVGVRTLGSLAAADTRAANRIRLQAATDATVGQASSGGDIEIYAGRLESDGSYGYDAAFRALVTGTLSAGGSVRVEAGGFAEFASSSRVLSNNAIRVRTGDDIVVQPGSSLVSGIDPNALLAMSLLAGDIDIGGNSGDLVGPITTPIASLIVRGSLQTNGRRLVLSGDAIDATGSAITTGQLFADVTDAPIIAPYSSDGGLLTPGCFQASACLGTLVASGDVAIGLASDNGMVSLRTGTIEFTGARFEAATREALELGSATVPGTLAATSLIALESELDFVALANLALTSPSLQIRAGTYLGAASSSLQSGSDILLAVGSDVVAGTIATGGRLDDGSGLAVFTVPGSITVGSLTYGGGNAMRIDARGEISVASAQAGTAPIDFTAGGAIMLGTTGGGTAAIRLDGAAISFANLRATGLVALTARSGGVLGFSATQPVIDTAGDIAIAASGAISVADLAAGGGIAISGQSIDAAVLRSGGAMALAVENAAAIGSASAAGSLAIAGASVALGSASFGNGLSLTARTTDLTGSGLYQGSGPVELSAARGIGIGSVDTLGAVTLVAGADARFVELRSRDGSVGVTAEGAIVGSSVAANGSDAAGEDNVSLVAGGAITLDGVVSALNPVSRAQDDFTVRTAGAIAVVRAEAGRDLTLAAGSGTVDAANVAAGRDLALSGPAATLPAGSVGRNLTARATAGDIAGSGATVAGGTIDLDASGAIVVGSLDAAGGGLTLTAGERISFTDLTAGGLVSLSAGSGIAGTGDIAATGGGVRLATIVGATSLRDMRATGAVTLSGGGGLAMRDLAQGPTGSLTISYDGAIVVRDVAAAGVGVAGRSSVAFGALRTAGEIAIDAAGAVTGGALAANGFASIDAGGAIALSGLNSAAGRLRSTGGSVTASGVAVGGLLDATGTALALAAPGALQVEARATAGGIAITAGGDLRVNARATGDVALASTGGSVLIGSVGQAGGDNGGIGAEAVEGGGAVAVTAANAISVADSLIAGGALTMTAGGLVSLEGPARGQTIALRAGDIAIGAGGTLGSATTQRISLASTAAMNLGAGAAGGFALDAAEFGRIRSGGDLLLTALAGTGAGAGSLLVGSLTVNAGSDGQIGSGGSFGLAASGLLNVKATLQIVRAGSGSSLVLSGDAVDLDYANAALSVLDGANAATGRIGVTGRLITSMSASAAADIVGKTTEEITLRLGRADVARDAPLFRTGALTLEAREAILVQNSGGTTADERRGVTVGSLTVSGASDGRTLVVLNGIVANATGIGAAQKVTVTGALAAGSSVNGCALANIAACLVVPAPEALVVPPGSILFGTGDFIKEEEEGSEVEEGVADGQPEAPPLDTTRIDDPAGRPMIDDPVTGAGNEDLWQPPES